MTGSRVAILGGGNTAFSLAANLALSGWEALIWDHPDFAEAIAPIEASRTIELTGAAKTGLAAVTAVTRDPAEALAWSELLLCSVPSYAHRSFIEQLLPHLRPGHLLALLPGNLGAIEFASALRDAGKIGITPCRIRHRSYVCRKTGPASAVIWGVVSRLGVGVWPSSETDRLDRHSWRRLSRRSPLSQCG